MNKQDIEARLERSLRKQVQPPRLDGRFDAAVWSRIAAEEKKVAPLAARGARMPGWLVASNIIGVVVTVALVAICATRAMHGVDLNLEVGVELPRIGAETVMSWTRTGGPIISMVAVLFGLTFTRFGRRLISALR